MKHSLAASFLLVTTVSSPLVGVRAVIVDGIIDSSYGPPVAVDPGGDGNGNTNMDLLELYVTEDANRKVRLPTLIAVFTC